MKTRSLLSLAIGITIITIAYSPVLAEVDRTIQQLADGDYFYGETPTPNQAEAGYLVFRKTGSNIAGLFYQQGTNLSFCFQGTTKPNSTKSVTKRQ